MSAGAVLDANVLLMAGPRDTLLRAAEDGLFRPYWSAEILDESERNLARILAKRGWVDATDRAAYPQLSSFVAAIERGRHRKFTP
jgi:hypothetical protein